MAQSGRAPASGAGDRWFKSSHPDQEVAKLFKVDAVYSGSLRLYFAFIAQLVERSFGKAEVTSSTLVEGSKR